MSNLIKRKDGSYSRRGLWDNIRANRGSGRKPTAEMLRQERKIRSEYADGGPVYNWIPPIYPRVGARNAQGGWLDQYDNGGSIEDQRIPTPAQYKFGLKYAANNTPMMTANQMGTRRSTLPDGKIVDSSPEIPAYAHGATVFTKQTTPTWVAGTPTPTTTQREIAFNRSFSPGTAVPYPEVKIPASAYTPASPPVLQGYNPYNGPMRLHAPDTTRMANGGHVTEKYKKRVGIPYTIHPGTSDAGMYVGPTTQRGITFANGGWLDTYSTGEEETQAGPTVSAAAALATKPYFNPAVVQSILATADKPVTTTTGRVISTPETREKKRREKIVAEDPSKYTVRDYEIGIKEPGAGNSVLDDPLAMAFFGGFKAGQPLVKALGQYGKNVAAEATMGLSDLTKASIQSVKPIINTAKNLEDLKAAQEFAQQYGYNLPTNLERIAQSNMLTDKVIRGMMDRHNTFVRGVSTNWEELNKRNPEILRHLEGKGFDLSTKEGTKAAAEYMATHIPINTGYGRASLDKEVFDEGMQGLYTSNSIPTAEGYTYGQGFVAKVKKPTNYSSSNRQDWITQNNPYYRDEDKLRELMYPLSEEAESAILSVKSKSWRPKYSDKRSTAGLTLNEKAIRELEYRIDDISKELEKANKGDLVYVDHDKTISKKTQTLAQLKEDIKYLEQHGDKLLQSPKEYRILRTEKSNIPTDPYKFLIEKGGDVKKMSEFLKTQPYKQKMEEAQALGESLHKYTWAEQQPIRNRIDILTKEATDSFNQSIQEYMKSNHPDYDPINKYAHYIHLGTPGEKVLEPIKSWEITPEIWKNKSRSHTNKYTKKLSAMENGGVVSPNKYKQGGWLDNL